MKDWKARLSPGELADAWEGWCGPSLWSQLMRQLDQYAWTIKWWGGYPRSASAIPLCFVMYRPDGSEFPGHSRLKDIRAAVAEASENTKGTHTP